MAGAWLLIRCTLTALVLTAFLAGIIERMFGLPSIESLAPVALFIGALGNGWRPVFDALGFALASIVGRAGGEKK
jgi:succinate dehydrogenase hydrophobic anchor subunit